MTHITRLLSLFALLTVLTAPLTVASPAAAQDLDVEVALDRLDPAARTEARAELASIDELSSLATAGYVTSIAVHIAGLGMMTVGSIGGFCLNLSFSGGSSCPDRTGWNTLIGVGGAMAGAGLIGLFVSIGVDGMSGRRRNAWRSRYGIDGVTDLDVAFAPTEGGASLALSGRF